MNNSLELGKKVIKERIPLTPKNPGIYRMISVSGEILYIGKAKNIPNRLKSYVSDTNLPIRTERMLSLTHNLEVTTTNNESEALLLEANLIKKHKPRFNILLRDDKSFPYIYIGHKDKWPQLTKLRGKKARNGYYFGPFASIGSANWTIKILQKIFQIRVCDDTVFKNRERPCILYQIKRCSGPCVGHIDESQYKKTVKDAIDFISGKSRRIQKSLSKEMELASKELDFEKAAIARDRIKALTQIQTSQKINQTNLSEADVVSIYKESGKTCIQVFFFRSKQNWGNQAFYPKHDTDDDIKEIITSFLTQFYENKVVPSMIITNTEVKDLKLLEKAFSQKEKRNVLIKKAKSKDEINISKLAEKNAKQALTQKLYQTESNNNLIENLANKFDLNNNINLIEVYDNSHNQGSDSIGALICFGNEGFVKKRYRKFNIRDEKVKNDDYGMMKEVLFRRFSKAIKEKSGSLSLPELILIDGGKGQYSVSRDVLNELGLHDLPILAVAKGKNRNAGEEKIYHENKEYILKKNDPLLFFIQRLRDEAHRFAISTHRAKRKKGLNKSLLDQIDGIGKQRKRSLLNHFGSARSVESASLEDLKSVEGIEESIAKKIYDYFHE
ncbi:MAG: excinuclease ABC subunit C [Candidatus Pelagibacter sp.]|nr:excinuclease ABC subunit C [Candidatus Pelagibacter sp.]OUW69437.1 MAG: excinuclease ABC subunit C [Candidatus Pelagibacter sp. TMED202]|tara:strand:- start:1467 stop:3305 length:1839 start_codon:yes stop_codon:yes gene_type:complete